MMSGKTRILVVGDDVQLVGTVKALLESVGYQVHCAHETHQGLALAREIRPDLIVLDLPAEGPSENESLEVSRLQRDPLLKDTPVIVLTSAKSAQVMPFTFGPDDAFMPLWAVLDKPLKPGELLAEIEQLLSLRDSEKEKVMANILVVDDDPDFVMITARVLQSRGYDVMTAANGSKALELMRAQKPDLVLLDIMMSTILDGLSVSEEMQADPELKDVPIIMISSISDTEHAAAFPTDEYVHMNAWISKPVRPDDLLKKVERNLK
jgi:CheY-like chemotaxis protein